MAVWALHPLPCVTDLNLPKDGTINLGSMMVPLRPKLYPNITSGSVSFNGLFSSTFNDVSNARVEFIDQALHPGSIVLINKCLRLAQKNFSIMITTC